MLFWKLYKYHLSRDTAQPTVFMHTLRLINLRWPHEDGLGPQLSKERTAKTDQSTVCLKLIQCKSLIISEPRCFGRMQNQAPRL